MKTLLTLTIFIFSLNTFASNKFLLKTAIEKFDSISYETLSDKDKVSFLEGIAELNQVLNTLKDNKTYKGVMYSRTGYGTSCADTSISGGRKHIQSTREKAYDSALAKCYSAGHSICTKLITVTDFDRATPLNSSSYNCKVTATVKGE